MRLREEGPAWARSLEFSYGSKMAWTLRAAQIVDGLHVTIGSSNDVDGVATRRSIEDGQLATTERLRRQRKIRHDDR